MKRIGVEQCQQYDNNMINNLFCWSVKFHSSMEHEEQYSSRSKKCPARTREQTKTDLSTNIIFHNFLYRNLQGYISTFCLCLILVDEAKTTAVIS